MTASDPHSYRDPAQPSIRHIEFDFTFDFRNRTTHGRARYSLDRPSDGRLFLDTHAIQIRRAQTGETPVPWSLGEADPILGQRLALQFPPGTAEFEIDFQLPPTARALQWMDASQTAGGRHPFMYSQCQAIHARSLFPCQDTPAVRFTYRARLHVPKPLVGLMAAAPEGQSTQGDLGVFSFHMPQPIPSYLFGLAVGDLTWRDISARCRIYAEPPLIEAAAWEFAETEQMLQIAEGLYGPYLWDRYDLLMLPRSFPYGGMENPRLTFANAIFLTGDRADTSLVAHELAHSWTGNLVTNASWEDFWLNEGWTTYAEFRICERLYGREYVELAAVRDRNLLFEDYERFRPTPQYTQLKFPMQGVDPEETFSRVPYYKGLFLLILIEQSVGRETFDAFIHGYILDHAFRSLTTEQFLDYLRHNLPQAFDRVAIEEWIYQPGYPADGPVFRSRAFEAVEVAAAAFIADGRLTQAQLAGWSPDQIVLFLQQMPETLPPAACRQLDRVLDMPHCQRFVTQSLFYSLAIRSGYRAVWPRAEALLLASGSRLSLMRLFRAVAQAPWTRSKARALYERARRGYHPLTQQEIERLLVEEGL